MKTKVNYWLWASVIFFIAENCWFGWNRKPSCTAERVCDYIVVILFWVGFSKWFVSSMAEEVAKKIKINHIKDQIELLEVIKKASAAPERKPSAASERGAQRK